MIYPNEPGCYLFKDDKSVIYVGKAKNLNKRIRSYFSKKHDDEKTIHLVKNIKKVDYIVTNTEVEALILENNLIKKYFPKYNINLKDSRRYAYILETDEPFPRFVIARDRLKNGKYYGPFTSAQNRDYILNFINKSLKIRTCKRLPKRACLRYSIGLCKAPCILKVSKTEYLTDVANARLILKGKNSSVKKHLVSKMKSFSKDQFFEKAMEMRDTITALEFLDEKQTMERDKSFDEDIINYKIHTDKVYLLLFNVKKGMLYNKQEFIINNSPNFLNQFILQYYSEHDVPKSIIVPDKTDPALSVLLNKRRKTHISIPKIGSRKSLLDLVAKNIMISFFTGQSKVEDLMNKLKLNEYPKVIECFDISHLHGTHTVASMVQFTNGLATKSNYRRFKIRSVEGIDDFRSMAEVIRRRYSRLKDENREMPNLILIDGGKGQLQFALQELKKLHLKIPILSLAKKFEEIYAPGRRLPIKLDQKSKALKYLREIRDEAHRFAINYNRLLRKNEIRPKK